MRILVDALPVKSRECLLDDKEVTKVVICAITGNQCELERGKECEILAAGYVLKF